SKKPNPALKKLLLTSFRFMPNANLKKAINIIQTATCNWSWNLPLYMKILQIRPLPLQTLKQIWKAKDPWTDWFVETLVLGKPKWPFGLLLKLWTMGSKLLFWYLQPFLPINIPEPLKNV